MYGNRGFSFLGNTPKLSAYLAGVFQNNPYGGAVNGSLWTLPVEMVCYISVPILDNFLRLNSDLNVGKNRRWTSALVIICMYVGTQICLKTNIFDRIPTIQYIATSSMAVIVWFFAGELFCCIESRKIARLVGGIGVLVYVFAPSFGDFEMPCIIGALFSELVYWGNKDGSLLNRLPRINDICYGMYLYGFPIEQMVVNFFIVKRDVSISNELLFGVALAIDVIFAIGSYYLVECPLSGIINRKSESDINCNKMSK